ncbi:MAG: LptF/LptG family permease [Lentisphaeria bacterium]|nr:LptF/LptG family permease [Lentisphaeria bacterium]
MKTLNLYIARSIVLTTLVAVGILTFVMLSGTLLKVFEFLGRGMPPLLLLRYVMYMLPDLLRYTLPLSLLIATVLVFNRLSADNEITAMKASGISLWQIISPALAFAVLLSAICFWLSADIAPHCRYKAWRMRHDEAIDPLMLIEPGRFIWDIPGYAIRVARREGNRLYGIQIWAFEDEDGKMRLRRDIYAQAGTIRVSPEKRSLELELEDATLATVRLSGQGKVDDVDVSRAATTKVTLPVNYGTKGDQKRLVRKPKFLGLSMLFARICLESQNGGNVTAYYVRLHSRMSWALAPLAFLLMGIPFAIRSRRSETSIGLLLATLLGVGFYVFILVADSLKHRTVYHPELLVWLPNIIYQVGGLIAIHRIERR